MSSQQEWAAWTVEQMSDAAIFADRDGLIRTWNAAAEALFGYTAEEVCGRTLDVIIPEHLRAAHWKAYHEAIASGATRYGRRAMITRSLNKAGEKLYVEMSFAVINDPDGNPVGAFAVARDATQRHLSERALRQRLAELEGVPQSRKTP